MNISVFIGQRLGFKTAKGGKTSPGVIIAVTGIALSLIIMMFAIAIVTGFKHEISNKLTGFNAALTIYPPEHIDETAKTDGIRLSDTITNTIQTISPGSVATLSIRQPAILKTDNAFQGVILKGMPDDGNWDFINSNLIAGTLPNNADNGNDNTIVISEYTAATLGLAIGDKIKTHFFENNAIRTRNLCITGIYNSHFNEYDRTFAFTPIGMLQQLCNVDSITGTSIEVNGIPTANLTEQANKLTSALLSNTLDDDSPKFYRVQTVLDACAMYYNWLDLLDTNVIVILILMACVSGFTLISSLFIIILERINMIGIMKAMGATNAQIRAIFIYMAQRLVVKGLVIGNIIGLTLLLIQQRFHTIPLDSEAYYLDFVPVEINPWYIIVLNLAVVIISSLLLILPSHIISGMSPARSIRYE